MEGELWNQELQVSVNFIYMKKKTVLTFLCLLYCAKVLSHLTFL